MLKLISLLNITGLFLFKMFFITDVVVRPGSHGASTLDFVCSKIGPS